MRSSSGRSARGFQNARERAAAARPSRIAARSRGPARSRLRRESARGSRARAPARAATPRARRGFDKKVDRIEPRVIAAGSVSGLARRSARSRAPAGVTVRSIVARSDPRARRRGSGQFEIGARRGIDLEARAARAPGRGRQRRARLDLGALDVGERRRGGGDLARVKAPKPSRVSTP